MMTASSVTTAEARRNRNILRLFLAGAGALCLPALLTREYASNFLSLRDGNAGISDGEIINAVKSLEEIGEDNEMHRLLMGAGSSDNGEEFADDAQLAFPDWLLRATEGKDEGDQQQDLESAMAAAIAESPPTYPQPDVKPYTIADAFRASALFTNTYGTLVYDPEGDEFLFLYDKHQNWVSGCTKLKVSFRIFALLLRKTFPERFRGPGSPELVIGISSGDYPHLQPKCLSKFPHATEACMENNNAPVLQFGSVFRNPEVFPNMIAMPMPQGLNLYCFKYWVAMRGQKICQGWRPAEWGGGLAFGDGLEWENLIPQVVWRGTDFGFLNHIETSLRQARYSDFGSIIAAAAEEESETDKKTVIERAMRNAYDNLYPRWKGVVLTTEATREAEEEEGDALPWVDIKFSGASPSAGAHSKQGPEYEKFEENGIYPRGDRKNLQQLAEYKYHIDLGGGGGTTWSGTIQKLAMPGLLFHHMTPTKDYIHDKVKPWQHYIPVAPDLSDLKEKYDWAESHPEAAKLIANQGSELIRHFSTLEGFEEMFQEVFVEPVRRVIEAYQPVETTHPGMTWREAFGETVGRASSRKIAVRESCPGWSGKENECTKIYTSISSFLGID